MIAIVVVLIVYLIFIYSLLNLSSKISREEEARYLEEGEAEDDSDAEAD